MEFRECNIYELASWTNGIAYKNINFCESGIPIIKIAELKNGLTDQTKYTNQIFDESVSLKKGDMLFSWSGNPWTSIDVFKYRYENGWLNQHIFKVIPDENKVNKEYFFYLMKYHMKQFMNIASQKQTTGLGHVTIKDLKQFKTKTCDKTNQVKIKNILEGLDKKIELNNKINDNLHKIILSVYNEKIKNNEKDIFEIRTLDEICNVFTGKKNANASEDNGKYKFFTCAPEPLNINTFIYDGPAIIVAGNGAYTGRTTFYNGKFDLYQRTYAITEKEVKGYIYLLYAIVKADLQENIMGGTHGSAIPYIVMDDIAKFKVKYNKEIFDDLSKKIKSMLIKIKENEKENNDLSQLRDTLLPQLMNGEIDLDKIEV